MNRNGLLEKFLALGNSYWLTRFVILRLLGFVYAIAFLVAANQLVPLIGEHGLTPATHFLNEVHTQLGSGRACCECQPSFGSEFPMMHCRSSPGSASRLSLVVLSGYANAILLAVLWAMYMSIVHIGQIWYGYGWEIQLLETGFLSIFLCPLLDAAAFPEVQAADSGDLAFSLARFSHHVWRRPDQIARRSLLARSHMSLLSL